MLKFSVGNPAVKPIARSGFDEHFFQPRDLLGDAAARIAIHVRDVKIVMAIIVVISPGSTHGIAVGGDTRLCGDICETARAIVTKQHIETPIVGDVEIRTAIPIVISPSGLHRVAPDSNRVVFWRRLETPAAAIYQ